MCFQIKDGHQGIPRRRKLENNTQYCQTQSYTDLVMNCLQLNDDFAIHIDSVTYSA